MFQFAHCHTVNTLTSCCNFCLLYMSSHYFYASFPLEQWIFMQAMCARKTHPARGFRKWRVRDQFVFIIRTNHLASLPIICTVIWAFLCLSKCVYVQFVSAHLSFKMLSKLSIILHVFYRTSHINIYPL